MGENIQLVNTALKGVALAYKELSKAFEPFATPLTKPVLDIFFQQMNLLDTNEELKTDEDVKAYIQGIVTSVSMQTQFINPENKEV